nr:Ig-like domain-containing protein [Hymenobacter sp. DG25A]
MPSGATTGKIQVSPPGNTTATSGADFTVTVAPVAVADVASTTYKLPTTINILNNDTPGSAGAPSAINTASVVLSSTTGSNGGTFSVNASGVVSFTPPATIVGTSITTSVSYTVANSASPAQRSAAATITVTVTNTAPVANNDPGNTVAASGTDLVINALSNDTDANGNGTIDNTSIVLGTATGTSSGTFAKGTGANLGKVVFTPTATAGTATVTYTVKDDAGLPSNSATITVVVIGAPIVNPDVASTNYKTPITISILSNDVAADGGAGANAINVASVILSQGATSGTSNVTGSNGGTFSVSASGVVSFTPPATIVGSSITTSVSYTVANSATPAQISNSTTITVTVTNATPVAIDGVNVALVNTANATALSPSLSGADVENDLFYYTITGGLPTAAQGLLAFNGTLIATTPSVNIPAGQLSLLTFDPAAGYVGRVVLTFTVTDGSGLSSSPTTYTIPVGAANTISGIVYEDVNYGGGMGRSQAASSGIGRNGATVELYTGANAYQAVTTTGVNGIYTFSGLAAGTYKVRVVNSTVTSRRGGFVAGLLPVQTYVNSDGNRVGGEAPNVADAAARTAGNLPANSQSLATVTLAANGAVGSDFGFSFDVVVNTNDTGQGSLRQFITNANALVNTGLDQRPFNNNGFDSGTDFPAGQETSIFMIPDGTAKPGLRAGLTNQLKNAAGTAATINSRALITLGSSLSLTNATTPANAAGTAIDGTTQSTLNNSNPITLGTGGTVGTGKVALSKVNGSEVEIVGPTNITNLIQVSADNSIVRGVSLHGGANALTVTSGTNMLIEQNLIGVDAFTAGAAPAPATSTIGVKLTNPSGTVQNNLIAYAGSSGLSYSGIGAGYIITNNEFDKNGRITAGGDNITIADQIAAGSVAGPVTITGNLIANANSSGIQFDIAKLSTNKVQNNTVSGNGLYGAVTRLEGSGIHYLSRNGTDRGTNPDIISQNIITQNQSSGIVINYGQRGIRISQNSIYQNGNGTTGGQGLLSVDLTPATYYVNSADANGKSRYGQGDGVTANDGVANVNQANGGMDYPVITLIEKAGPGQLRVKGYIGNNPAGSALFANTIVEVYSANNADTNQNGPTTTTSGDNVAHGEAQSYVGTLTADANGLFDVTFNTIAATINSGDIVSATAYLAAYGTSEAGVNKLSDFTVTLPVELVSFEAKAGNTNVQLTWATASEKNNDHFAVERSFDGITFAQIGQVRGNGNSTNYHYYSCTDVSVGLRHTGTVYYRLQQVDVDGQAHRTSVRAVNIKGTVTANSISLYPNPATEQATLDLRALPAGTYQVHILDMMGREVYRTQVQGGGLPTVDLRAVRSGTYQVLIQGNQVNLSHKLVKYK